MLLTFNTLLIDKIDIKENRENVIYLKKNTMTFNSADSKSIQSTMPGIMQWAEEHPDDPVYK